MSARIGSSMLERIVAYGHPEAPKAVGRGPSASRGFPQARNFIETNLNSVGLEPAASGAPRKPHRSSDNHVDVQQRLLTHHNLQHIVALRVQWQETAASQ